MPLLILLGSLLNILRSVGQDVSPGKCVLLSTSKSVRKAMRLWEISGGGSFWKVQLDVRDLGGHLDITRRARAGTLSKRVGEAINGVAAVGALPLGFQVKLGQVRGTYLPAGLHAAEASHVSSSSISAFGAAIVRAVWSSKMPLANAPAIFDLLDGPVGIDPAFHIVWTRFRMMRRYLAYCPEEEPRIFRMLDFISRDSQCHGPVHLVLMSAAELGFAWGGAEKGWVRVSLPPLRIVTGPVQQFYSSILDGAFVFLPSYLRGKAFEVLSMLILRALYNNLPRPTCGNEIQCYLEPFCVGAFGTDSFLARPRRKMFPAVFVVKGMEMDTYFGSVLFTLQHVKELHEFATLMSLDRSKWPRVCFGMGGCPDSVVLVTVTLGDLAFGELERCLGAYPVDIFGSWTPPECWDADDIALEMSDHPDIWTDGSWEDFSSVGGFEVAGAGVYLPASEVAFDSLVWRTAEEYGDARLERCRAFLPVPAVMQTVQRAEFWGAIVAMQAYWPFHLGIDNLNVAGTVGRLLDNDCLVKPLPLVKDGDLVALVQYMISTRGRETVRVTKVKGHAEDSDVQQGRVRLENQLGNAEADTAADLGRPHQSEVLIYCRRRLLRVRSHRYPIMLQLHRFMIAVARVTVNHDGRGGTAPDPLVWDQGGQKKHASLIFGSMLILPLFPAFLVS